MKHIFNKIYTFIWHLFYGMHNADKIAFSSKNNSFNNGTQIESEDSEDSVYKDLLKGEVTQSVRELRHEMYYAERESHKYEYTGGGLAKKKNDFFQFKGCVENSDNLPIQLIQDNKEDCGSLYENMSETYLGINTHKKYTLTIQRDFQPRFKIEKYASRIVVKRVNENTVLLDLYFSKYPLQFDTAQHLFLTTLNKIYEGDKRSELLDFKTLSFITTNAYGCEDYKRFTYKNIKFENIKEFGEDGKKNKNNYILTFYGEIVEDGYDLLSEVYDKTADEKFKTKAPRKNNTTADFMTALSKQSDKYDYNEADILIKNMEK